MKTTFDKLRDLNACKCDILIFNNNYTGEWDMTIKSSRDGVKIEVEDHHPDFGTLIDKVYDKFISTTQFGAPALAEPLTKELAPPAPPPSNDEIPY